MKSYLVVSVSMSISGVLMAMDGHGLVEANCGSDAIVSFDKGVSLEHCSEDGEITEVITDADNGVDQRRIFALEVMGVDAVTDEYYVWNMDTSREHDTDDMDIDNIIESTFEDEVVFQEDAGKYSLAVASDGRDLLGFRIIW